MENLDKIEALFSQLLQQLQSVQFLWQLAVLLLSLAAARYAHRRASKYLHQRLGPSESPQIRIGRMAARGGERMVFPLTVFLITGLIEIIANSFKVKAPLLGIATTLALSLAIVRLSIYVLRRSFSPSQTLRAWEGVISFVVWSVVALHLLGWLPGVTAALDDVAFKIGSIRFSLLSILKLGVVLAIFITLAGWVARRLEAVAGKSTNMSAGMRVGLAKSIKVFLYTVAILISLDSVGIDLTTLAVFGGALGVGLGFGLQRIASNFISGFILLFDRSIKPGDVISVGERFGWVQELHARYIVVRDRDGVETLIPNENLITSEVVNWSYSDRNVRVRLPVQISYDSDPEAAMNIMVEAGGSNERVLKDPPPQCRLLGFGENGIDLELRLWVLDPEEGVGNLRSDVNLEIWRRFKEAGIVIPFPQRDVRIISQPGST